MRRIIACLLTIIYLGFTAGAVVYETFESDSHFAGKVVYGNDISASNEDASGGSYEKNIKLYKVHKHLAASRTFKVPRVSFPTPSAPIYISTTNNAYKQKQVNTVIPESSPYDIFIKNCVLRI